MAALAREGVGTPKRISYGANTSTVAERAAVSDAVLTQVRASYEASTGTGRDSSGFGCLILNTRVPAFMVYMQAPGCSKSGTEILSSTTSLWH